MKMKIYEGGILSINWNENMVKKSDDISKIAKDNGVSLKSIVIENFWLVEKNRVQFQ